MFEELGLGEVVDEALGSDVGSKLSLGMCLKAMIVNGLGFTTRSLYYFFRPDNRCAPSAKGF
jgi:hypothetical protein